MPKHAYMWWLIKRSMTSLKNITKGDIEKKCPGSLCFTLL